MPRTCSCFATIFSISKELILILHMAPSRSFHAAPVNGRPRTKESELEIRTLHQRCWRLKSCPDELRRSILQWTSRAQFHPIPWTATRRRDKTSQKCEVDPTTKSLSRYHESLSQQRRRWYPVQSKRGLRAAYTSPHCRSKSETISAVMERFR